MDKTQMNGSLSSALVTRFWLLGGLGLVLLIVSGWVTAHDNELFSTQQTCHEIPASNAGQVPVHLRNCLEFKVAGLPAQTSRQEAQDQVALTSQAAREAKTPQEKATANASLERAQDELAKRAPGFPLALYMNGHAFPAESLTPGDKPGTYEFRPELPSDANADVAKEWRRLLAMREGGTVKPSVRIALTDRDGPDLFSGTVKYEIFRPWLRYLAVFGWLLLFIGILGLAYDTALLRDGTSNRSRYSLAKVQMAFWFVATFAGMIYIFIVTGQFENVITTSTVALLGISGATTMLARTADAGKDEIESENFVKDMIGSKAAQVELNRLQMIAWTFFLGGIYVYNILLNFVQTQFDDNMLILAGVVSGVYVGQKQLGNAAPSAGDAGTVSMAVSGQVAAPAEPAKPN